MRGLAAGAVAMVCLAGSGGELEPLEGEKKRNLRNAAAE